MPLVGFICPDKTKVKIDACVNCVHRCHSLAYLESAGHDREWKGVPSTTQLIGGTRAQYLKITQPYYIDPEGRAFAILGSWSHAKLDYLAKDAKFISELKLDGDITGTLDKLEPDPIDKGCWYLIDHKTWGSFSLVKKDGDNLETELQLNNYRCLVEHNDKIAEIVGSKIKISKMLVEVIIRDGNTKSAFMNKVNTCTKMVEVNRLDDKYVSEFFATKRTALLTALNTNTLPPACDSRENWGWRKCKNYCEVFEYCPEGRKINKCI